ncbi:2-oxoisovalerate dehydrogenase E2 component (dihydrolipoyl transacylase) [Geosmithia morbida]|uniref:Dihydrolipoamide acetyltransferase component of pyruvate dehydrogenase complex n=1 Tax=Geosmithia morbida TaxID=1094350 RepID=A0A9P4YX67_9HYPO|nr:2-oxoisovalerate dehydrogenase E2 component (dihydrolipoyl transacylase) [Geosmithia morbida]KAF4123371.1 2-oxoisovalerate dehydrogenase E2 component (dihydrolipoyl transacylase) [Geosmithia morbida]
MLLQRASRLLRGQWQTSKTVSQVIVAKRHTTVGYSAIRWFTESRRLFAIKPVPLADIGEGIVECEVIQWFVEPGATVEEFSPLCEVQSDKASVEITSRFSGTVKKLYYEAGEMASVGRPFIDIDVQDDDVKDGPAPAPPNERREEKKTSAHPPPRMTAPQEDQALSRSLTEKKGPELKGKCAALSTPAVRHLSKEFKVDINDIDGTGKDGRVTKEDIYKFVGAKKTSSPGTLSASPDTQVETTVPLSSTQQQMFKTMTRSLGIPHFLYADEVDFSSLAELRGRLNRVLSKPVPSAVLDAQEEAAVKKLSYLPFIIKAVSLALRQFPTLNARVDTDSATGKPCLVHRSQHNIGVAMDTPQGLVVPVVRDVASLNVLAIAAELARLQDSAVKGRLSPRDMTGGTISVSNIGNIGGTYLSPVIVEREVAILGVGRIRSVPAFDEEDNIVKKQVCNFSWSADHRVVDGATMARAADVVRAIVEEPDVMVMHLR